MAVDRTDKIPYRSPTNVKVFVGDIWLDDVVDITYQVSDEVNPIYGFRNSKFSGVMHGKTLVQGQLICHFRYPGYLTRVLEKVKTALQKEADFQARRTPGRSVKASDDPTAKTTLLQEAAKQGAAALAYLSEAMKAPIWNADTTATKAVDTRRPGQVQEEDNKTFDLRIVYGRIDRPQDSMVERNIQEVYINGESHNISIIDGNGDSCLYEVYTFLAKNITGK